MREKEGCKVKLDNKLVVFEPHLGIYFQSNFSGKPFENLASIVHFYIGLMKGAKEIQNGGLILILSYL